MEKFEFLPSGFFTVFREFFVLFNPSMTKIARFVYVSHTLKYAPL